MNNTWLCFRFWKEQSHNKHPGYSRLLPANFASPRPLSLINLLPFPTSCAIFTARGIPFLKEQPKSNATLEDEQDAMGLMPGMLQAHSLPRFNPHQRIKFHKSRFPTRKTV